MISPAHADGPTCGIGIQANSACQSSTVRRSVATCTTPPARRRVARQVLCSEGMPGDVSRRRGKRGRSRRRAVVLESSAAIRAVLLDEFVASGYDVSGTGSVDLASLLVQAGRVDVVFVNLSAFPIASLTALARALRVQPKVHIVATLDVLLAKPTGHGKSPSQSRVWQTTTHWLLLADARQLRLVIGTRPPS